MEIVKKTIFGIGLLIVGIIISFLIISTGSGIYTDVIPDTTISDSILADNGSAQTLTQSPSTITSVTTKNDTWLSFDGVNNFVNLSNNNQFIFEPYHSTGEGGISLWVKTDEFSGVVQKTVYHIINRTNILNDNQIMIVLDYNNFSFRAGSNSNTSQGFEIINDSWTNIIVTWNPTNAYGYANTENFKNLTETIKTPDEISERYVGRRTDAQFFNGSVDEIREYNRTLNLSEVEEIYNSGRQINNSLLMDGLILWIPFNENSGTDVHSFNETDLT